MGMFIIKPAGLSLDVTSDIITLGIIDIKPFKILFKNTSRCGPNIGYVLSSGPRVLINEAYPSVILTEVNACINLIDGLDTARTLTKSKYVTPEDLDSKTAAVTLIGIKVNFRDPPEAVAAPESPSLKRNP